MIALPQWAAGEGCVHCTRDVDLEGGGASFSPAEVNKSSETIHICGNRRFPKQLLHYKKRVKISNYFISCLFSNPISFF